MVPRHSGLGHSEIKCMGVISSLGRNDWEFISTLGSFDWEPMIQVRGRIVVSSPGHPTFSNMGWPGTGDKVTLGSQILRKTFWDKTYIGDHLFLTQKWLGIHFYLEVIWLGTHDTVMYVVVIGTAQLHFILARFGHMTKVKSRAKRYSWAPPTTWPACYPAHVLFGSMEWRKGIAAKPSGCSWYVHCYGKYLG